jgi:hypothetical protein
MLGCAPISPMIWILLLSTAIACLYWGQYRRIRDDVYRVSLYSAGVLSGLWGWAIAPPAAQMTLGVLVLSWAHVQRSPPQR